jgi:hypothetical protein
MIDNPSDQPFIPKTAAELQCGQSSQAGRCFDALFFQVSAILLTLRPVFPIPACSRCLRTCTPTPCALLSDLELVDCQSLPHDPSSPRDVHVNMGVQALRLARNPVSEDGVQR